MKGKHRGYFMGSRKELVKWCGKPLQILRDFNDGAGAEIYLQAFDLKYTEKLGQSQSISG